MYRIKDVTPEELRNIQVPNQERIERYRGSKLNPLESFQLIKEFTQGFTKDDPIAKEADKLLYWLIYPEKREKEQKRASGEAIKEVIPPSKISLEEMRMKEKERARELELLELELELEIESKKKTA